MTTPRITNYESHRDASQLRITKDLLALLLLAVLVLLFFWRIITPKLEDRAIFPPGDFSDQFWAFRMYEARAFAAGRLPLWSENFNSGHPFLADVQSAIFYPIGLIFTLGVVALRGAEYPLLALELEAILHFFLAGAFTYLFARRLLGSRVATLVSAITFTFGGYLTSYPPQQLAILETATWLPLALLFLDVGIGRGLTRTSADEKTISPRLSALIRVPMPFVAAGVVLGIAALAGHPQTFLFVVYASAIYSAWRITNYELRITNYVSRFILTLAIATGLSAAQWIPTLEYQSVSTRMAISWADAARGFPTIDPLQMILPGFTAAFQSPLYIGVLPLWLAVFALFVNRTREKIFWALFALGSLLVAFGFYVFAYAVLYLAAPGFGLFRDQERLAFLVSVALAILAGFGARELLKPTFDPARARRAWALLPAGVTISVMMLFVFYSAATIRSSGRLSFLLDRSGLMVLLFAMTTTLVAWLLRASPAERESLSLPRSPMQFIGERGRVGWGFALALIVFDLFSINNAAYNADPLPRYPVTSLIETIRQDDRIFRVADEGQMPGHFGIGYNLDEIGGISPLRVARYDALLDALPPEKLWQLLGVRYVITGRPGFANSEVMATDDDTRLLRLKNYGPRAWLAVEAKQADDRTALAAMQSDEFDPWVTAYVADPLPFPVVPNQAFTAFKFDVREPERLMMSFRTPTDSLLMLSEVYYPGWRATVDGVPTPILRADVALRAVAVRAGEHRVEMVYDPWSVKFGIGITLATALLVITWIGVWLARYR